jgi:hypothetical protein
VSGSARSGDRSGPIGVVGGYGAVGAATARLLHGWGSPALRIGGRDVRRCQDFVDRELGGAGTATAVDVYDDASLAAFCVGCSVVVNCAGPSYQVLDRVAVAAFAAGAHYVDPGGDQPVWRALQDAGLPGGDRAAVLNAGLMPGYTALLPLGLARSEFVHATHLRAYAGLVDRMTPAGAAEYLLSLGGGHGEPQAAWRAGAKAHRVLEPLSDVDVPYFPGRVDAHPFLSVETEWLAGRLGLVELDWYNVFDGGGNVMSALSRLQGAMVGESDLDSAAAELARAAELDLFGREPYQVFVFAVEGMTEHGHDSRVLVLRCTDTYAITGLLAAQATAGVLAGDVTPGLHYAAEVVDYPSACRALRENPAVSLLDVVSGPLVLDAVEEGAL